MRFALGSQRKRPKRRSRAARSTTNSIAVRELAGRRTPAAGNDHRALGEAQACVQRDGTVTAGNSSGINDGAAALLLCVARRGGELRLGTAGARRHLGRRGRRPVRDGARPDSGARKALRRAGVSGADLDLVEINEAFAAQCIACIRDLGLNSATRPT